MGPHLLSLPLAWAHGGLCQQGTEEVKAGRRLVEGTHPGPSLGRCVLIFGLGIPTLYALVSVSFLPYRGFTDLGFFLLQPL